MTEKSNRNKYFPQIITFLFLIFFILIHSPHIFAQESAVDRYGGSIVLATISDPKSFNDIVAKESSTSIVTSLIFEGLTRVNAMTLKVEPNLARKWDVSPDGKKWTFHLRQDVMWNDGEVFTSDDVVFTFNELIFNEAIPSSARDIFTIQGEIFKVIKVDKFTVQFILPSKFAPFLRGMGQAILPKHKLKKSVDEGKFNFTWGIDTPPEEIVGTGPFKLAEYYPGERLIFKRNDVYWKLSKEGHQLPYLEKIVYLIVQSQDTALLKFIDGELDYSSIRGRDYPLLKPAEAKGNYTVYDAGPNFGSNFIFFNLNPGSNPTSKKPYIDPIKLKWFLNHDFRKAVAHSIDKKKLIEILMNGLGSPQDASMSPSAGYFYNPSTIKYPYDLNKAKEILTQAGFIDRDNDGIIEDKEGHQVEFNLYTNANNPDRIQIAAIIRQDLQNIGMKVNFLALEFNSLVSKLTSTFDWEGMILGLTGGIEPHFGKNVWHSSGQLHMWYPRQEKPSTSWEARIDEIFNQGVQELNEEKRKELYDEHQMIVSRQLPLIYTVLASNIFAVRNKFGNLNPTSYGGAFHNLEEIYIVPGFR